MSTAFSYTLVGGAVITYLGSDIVTPSTSYEQSSSPVKSVEDGITDIAKKYGNEKCVEASKEISRYLKRKKQKHNIIELNFPNAYNGFVVSTVNDSLAITRSGKHYGVEYNGYVYCNIYPYGLPTDEWIKSFSAVDMTNSAIMPIVTRIPF